MPGSQCLHGMLLLCSFGVLRCASRSCCTTLAKAEPTKPDMLCTACRDNIFDFMHQRLGVPRDQAEAVWRPLFKQTNQSLKVGLPSHRMYMHPGQHAVADSVKW